MTSNTSLLYACSQILNYEIYKQTGGVTHRGIKEATQYKSNIKCISEPFSDDIFLRLCILYELRQTS